VAEIDLVGVDDEYGRLWIIGLKVYNNIAGRD